MPSPWPGESQDTAQSTAERGIPGSTWDAESPRQREVLVGPKKRLFQSPATATLGSDCCGGAQAFYDSVQFLKVLLPGNSNETSLHFPMYQQSGQHSRTCHGRADTGGFAACLFLGANNCAANYIGLNYPLTVLYFLLLQSFIGAKELDVFLWV